MDFTPWKPAELRMMVDLVKQMNKPGLLSAGFVSGKPQVHVTPEQMTGILAITGAIPEFVPNGTLWQVQVEWEGIRWVALFRDDALGAIGYRVAEPLPVRVA